MATTALPAVAQTEANPQVVKEGENTVTVSEAYFTYTPTENVCVMLEDMYVGKVTTTDEEGSATEVNIASYYSPKYTTFLAEKGKTYSFKYDGGEDSWTFNCVLNPITGSVTGPSCDDPIGMPESGVFMFPCSRKEVPNSWGGTDIEPIDFYLKYTAPSDGRLIIKCEYSLQAFYFGESCDDITEYVAYDYVGGYSIYEISNLEKDDTILIRAKGGTSTYATIEMQQVVPGSSCKDAFNGVAGKNVIPAAAGEYWYQFTADSTDSKCMFEVSSEAKATVKIFSDCGYYNPQATYDTPNFRYGPVMNKSSRVLCITKSEDTAAEESFDMTFATVLPIENDEVGQTVETGVEETTPSVAGYYYYSITSPANDPKLMVITSDAEKSYAIKVEPRDVSGAAVTGNAIKLQTEPGTVYLITVEVEDAPITFEVNFEDLQPGSLETYPITAELGDNEVPAFSPVYYTFSYNEDSKVQLSSDVEAVTFQVTYGEGYWTYDAPLTKTDDGYVFASKADTDYTIILTKPKGEEEATGTLTITQLPFAPGEAWQTAIPVETEEVTVGDEVVDQAEITLPNGPSSVWYVVTAPMSGDFNLSSTLSDISSQIEVYVGSVVPSNKKYTNFYQGFKLKESATEGTKIYVNVNNQSTSAATVTFTFSEPPVGTSATNPIVLTYEDPSIEITIPVKPYGEFNWYQIELPAGILNYGPANTGEYLGGVEIYKSDNLTNYIDYGYSYGLESTPIEAGTYLLKVYVTYGDPVKTILSVREPGPGETVQTAVVLDTTELPATVDVPALDYENYWIKFTAHEGELTILAGPNDYIDASLYSAEDLNTPLDSSNYYEIDGKSYRGFKDFKINAEGVYYFVPRDTDRKPVTFTFSGSALEAPAPSTKVSVEVVDGVAYSYTVEQNTESKLTFVAPANFKVESVEINGEAADVADSYVIDTTAEAVDYLFTLEYAEKIDFVDQTTGVVKLDTTVTLEVKDGKLFIENVEVGDQIVVYNMGGMIVATHTANNTAVVVPLDKGTYVVTVNGKAMKVIL